MPMADQCTSLEERKCLLLFHRQVIAQAEPETRKHTTQTEGLRPPLLCQVSLELNEAGMLQVV